MQSRIGKAADAAAASPKKEAKSTPTAADSRVSSKSPATPLDKSQEKTSAAAAAAAAANRLSSSGGVARPRRENRQPPKHLREAFDQLESEGVNLKRMIPKATKLPVEIMEDAPASAPAAAADPARQESAPSGKADEEMPPPEDNGNNSLPADSTVDSTKVHSEDGQHFFYILQFFNFIQIYSFYTLNSFYAIQF